MPYPKCVDISFAALKNKFGQAHAEKMRQEWIEISKEPMPPSGGWCNSCERYNCGHYTFDGMVITQEQDRREMEEGIPPYPKLTPEQEITVKIIAAKNRKKRSNV